MKRNILYLLSLFLFWMAIFFICRIFFILYQLPIGTRVTNLSDVFKAFYEGYRLDLATASILSVIPLLLITLLIFLNKKWIRISLTIIIFILILIYAAAGISDAGLYREWNAKLNMQALSHFSNPSEVYRTLSAQLIFLFFLLLTLLSVPFYILYKKKIHPQILHLNALTIGQKLINGLSLFILAAGIFVLLIRGGFSEMPINQSVAYFSPDALANDMAVNPLYNVMQDATITDKLPDAASYKFRSNEEAQRLIADDFFVKTDTSVTVLNTERPNIVFIILESWSADNVEVLGGIKGCTPQFNALAKEGILCTRAYANGYVSDQGMAAILSAYPSASKYAAINMQGMLASIPCISEDLLKQGYSTSFMFGGDLVYGGIRAYLVQKNFNELLDMDNWTQYPKGKLGVHDEYLFKELLNRLDKKTSPFLQCFFTTSTHMPYDYTSIPDDWHTADSDPVKAYTESVHYSDKYIGEFFKQAKTKPWYKNTLFVLVADHSHNSIKQWTNSTPMYSQIPLLFVGGALKEEWRGKTIDKVVSQLDIVSTLLHQMHLPPERYKWSRNIFNPYTPSSAYYVFYDGGGYVNDTGYSGINFKYPKSVITNMEDSSLVKRYNAKAASFYQLVYEEANGKIK